MVCKAGSVDVIALDHQLFPWSGTQIVILETQESTFDTSTFYPASGIELVGPDTVLIMGFDGALYFIGGLAEHPHLLASSDLGTLSEAVPNVRLACSNAESGERKVKGSPHLHEVTRIMGMSTYDQAGVLVWLQESVYQISLRNEI
jgi:hypothetical protein